MTDIELFDGIEIVQDLVAVFLTIVLIKLFISLNDLIKKKGYLSTTVTRKFIHIVAAPIYVGMWPLYSGEWFSPYMSLIVPGLFAMQFTLVGLGVMKNEEFVATMSRSGDPRELLKGTLYYAVFMIVAAVFFWVCNPLTDDHSPVGIVCMMSLAFGDGLADIVGRTADKMKFTVFAQKSVPGTLAMLVGSLVFSFVALAAFGFDLEHLVVITIIACVVATLAEVLSPKETDNILIPLAVIIVFAVLTPILAEDADWSIFHIFLP